MSAQRIVISGGTSGIGRATAALLAARGAAVWILGSRPDRLARTLAELAGLAGGGVCDVRDEAAVRAAIAEAVGGMGGLDGAFVNAGVDGVGIDVLELTAEDLRRVLDVNVVGAFVVAREAARAMLPAGRIVFNASVNALRAERRFADYNASKAAVVSLAQTMAVELAPRGIAVTTICPGYVPTEMTAPYLGDPATASELLEQIPAGRFGTTDEVAELVAFLLSVRAGYMSGAVVSIDGGRSV